MEVQNDCGVWEKTKGCLVPLEKLALLPLYHRETISETYLDAMGHMNVRWYSRSRDRRVAEVTSLAS